MSKVEGKFSTKADSILKTTVVRGKMARRIRSKMDFDKVLHGDLRNLILNFHNCFKRNIFAKE